MNCLVCGKPTRKNKRQCNSCAVVLWRRRKKLLLVEMFGGKCILCGYDRYVGSLDFHHTDPSTKEFALSKNGNTRSWEKLVKEASKCILVCRNCHGEIHGGIRTLAGDETGSRSNLLNCLPERKPVGSNPTLPAKLKRVSKKPPKAVLEYLITTLPMVKVGAMFEVSDTAVKKWAKSYDIYQRKYKIAS